MSIIMNHPMHEENLSHQCISRRQCKQPDRFGVFAEGALDSMTDEEEVDDIVVEAEVDEEEVVMVDYPLPSPLGSLMLLLEPNLGFTSISFRLRLLQPKRRPKTNLKHKIRHRN
jgi:hypothetical protein